MQIVQMLPVSPIIPDTEIKLFKHVCLPHCLHALPAAKCEQLSLISFPLFLSFFLSFAKAFLRRRESFCRIEIHAHSFFPDREKKKTFCYRTKRAGRTTATQSRPFAAAAAAGAGAAAEKCSSSTSSFYLSAAATLCFLPHFFSFGFSLPHIGRRQTLNQENQAISKQHTGTCVCDRVRERTR